jgi:hypothetical protein
MPQVPDRAEVLRRVHLGFHALGARDRLDIVRAMARVQPGEAVCGASDDTRQTRAQQTHYTTLHMYI